MTRTDTPSSTSTTPVPAAGDAAGELRVEVERRPGSQVELRIEAPAHEVDAAIDHALRHLAQRVRLPGFRPGKAPAPIVERAVGWPMVAGEVVESAVPSIYLRALDRAGVQAVGEPRFEVGDVERGAPLTVTAIVTVSPEVDLGDYRGIRVEEERTEVTEAQVDDTLEEVRRRHADLVEVDRPAEAGDVLRATLVMRRGDEVVGGAGEERDVELDRDKLIPGLTDGLLGLTPGARQVVEVALPDDYANEELRGASVAIEATVHAVRERRLPPLDDELAVLDGHGHTLDELRAHYRDSLVGIAERSDAERFEAAVLERLRDSAAVDVPEVMIEQEIDRQLRDLELRLAGTGLKLDRYLEYTGETRESLRAGRRDAAAQRVKLELALETLAAAEGIEVDESDVEREEAVLIGNRKVTADQRRRVHLAAHRDLLLRGAAQRALAIARGED